MAKTSRAIQRKRLKPSDYWEVKARLLDFQRRDGELKAAITTHAQAYSSFWRTTLTRLGLNPDQSRVEFLDDTCEVVQSPPKVNS